MEYLKQLKMKLMSVIMDEYENLDDENKKVTTVEDMIWSICEKFNTEIFACMIEEIKKDLK